MINDQASLYNTIRQKQTLIRAIVKTRRDTHSEVTTQQIVGNVYDPEDLVEEETIERIAIYELQAYPQPKDKMHVGYYGTLYDILMDPHTPLQAVLKVAPKCLQEPIQDLWDTWMFDASTSVNEEEIFDDMQLLAELACFIRSVEDEK